jgi:putative RecB family exonuclease
MVSLSASQLQAYLACPLKYRFQYVEKIPPPWRPAALAFGGSIHAAIEHFHKARRDGKRPTVDEILRIFEADWFAQNLVPLVFGEWDSKESLAEKGKAMLALYVEKAGDTLPRSIEERFEVELIDPSTGEIFDLRLVGVVDLVEENGTLVDVKTGARSVSQGDVERHLQLSIYALAHFLETQKIPALRLDQLLKTKTPRLEQYPTSRSVEDLSWTAQLAAMVARAIDEGNFYPNPSWRCTECEYFAHCQAWRGG